MLLGKDVSYHSEYNPDILFPINRESTRSKIKYPASEINGEDLWTIYEFSHLDEKSKPNNAILSLSIPHQSESIIESKSLKLYFNSFNHLNKNFNDVLSCIAADIENKINCKIDIHKVDKHTNSFDLLESYGFLNLDTCEFKHLNKQKWTHVKSKNIQTQKFYTTLFRSNCPVTNQPDWATIIISLESEYKVEPDELFRYLISFRKHQAFHESCVEEIISELLHTFNCSSISVYARFTRRGGIDINPIRYFGKLDQSMKIIVDKSKKLEFWDPRQ